MTFKNKLQHHIAIYEKRRAELRAQYAGVGWNKSREYTRRAKRLTRKIRNYRKRIYRLDRYFKQLDAIHKLVCDFMGVDNIRHATHLRHNPNCGDCQHNRTVRGRILVYKYALEQGVTPLYISEYMGCARNTPRQSRMRFTQSFISNPINYALWQNFRSYRQSQQEQIQLRA